MFISFLCNHEWILIYEGRKVKPANSWKSSFESRNTEAEDILIRDYACVKCGKFITKEN